MTSVPSGKRLLDVARAAAEAGAQVLRRRFAEVHGSGGALTIRTKDSATDFVTDVDAAAQHAVIGVIRAAFPDHRFLAEEEGADALGNPSSPCRWIIDPLDGTTCFIHGKENFGTIVAAEVNDVITAGVIRMPLMEREFFGTMGGGAFVDGAPVRLRATAGMNDAVLCSNLVHRARPGEDGVLQITTPPCASLENYGSAAEELGRVLLGQNDGVFFRGPKLWDVAAGGLLIAEAGGRFRWEHVDPADPRSSVRCVASTAPIFDELCAFVFEKNLA